MTEHEKILLDGIETLRRRNNGFWMQIVAIALKHAPSEVKPIMREIGKIDGEVVQRWAELAK